MRYKYVLQHKAWNSSGRRAAGIPKKLSKCERFILYDNQFGSFLGVGVSGPSTRRSSRHISKTEQPISIYLFTPGPDLNKLL